MEEQNTANFGNKYLLEIVVSWMVIVLNFPLIMHQVLLGVEDILDPNIIGTLIGCGIGIGIGIGLIVSRKFWARQLALVRTIFVIAVCDSYFLDFVINFFPSVFASLSENANLFLIVRFSLLIPAGFVVFYELMCVNTISGTSAIRQFSVPLFTVVAVTGSSLWVQRENMFYWPLDVTLLINLILAQAVLLLHLAIGRKASQLHSSVVPNENQMSTTIGKPLKSVIPIYLFLGVTPGLSLSLGALVSQNTSIPDTTSMLYLLGMVPIAVILILAFTDGSRGMRKLGRSLTIPGWTVILPIILPLLTIGLPWILGTENVLFETEAGMLHLAGYIASPFITYFIASQAFRTHPRPGHLFGMLLCGTGGFVLGVAGYLIGGNTYNIDFLIGTVYTVFLILGSIYAWVVRRLRMIDRDLWARRSDSNIEKSQGGLLNG
ncbi:MAG: hypothetical protein ACFFCS_10450 [Candidatus Hodarchaeota archaeon]